LQLVNEIRRLEADHGISSSLAILQQDRYSANNCSTKCDQVGSDASASQSQPAVVAPCVLKEAPTNADAGELPPSRNLDHPHLHHHHHGHHRHHHHPSKQQNKPDADSLPSSDDANSADVGHREKVTRAVAHAADDLAAHATAIKEFLKHRSEKEEHDVSEYYWPMEESVFSWVAQHNGRLETVTLAVVVLNGIWIAIDIDLNRPPLDKLIMWVIMDNLFCTYFSGELLVRFFAFQKKWKVIYSGWFMFDLILVLMMVFETWALPLVALVTGAETGDSGNAGVLRLLRLLRLSRMAKMMRSVPELMILIKGTFVGIRSVAITLGLLLGITVVFAIAMRTLTDGTEVGDERFPNVPMAGLTLLIEGVIPDNGELLLNLAESGGSGWIYSMLFFLFIFLAALTFMNMLIGILCEAVHGVSVDERESMDIRHMRDLVEERMIEKDDNFAENGEIVTRELFLSVMRDESEDACLMFDSLLNIAVDIPSLIDNAKTIFADPDAGLRFDEFMDVVLKFRATDASMIQVIFEVRALVYDRMFEVDRKLTNLSEGFNSFKDRSGPSHGQNSAVVRELRKIEDVEDYNSEALCKELIGIKDALAQVLQKSASPQEAPRPQEAVKPTSQATENVRKEVAESVSANVATTTPSPQSELKLAPVAPELKPDPLSQAIIQNIKAVGIAPLPQSTEANQLGATTTMAYAATNTNVGSGLLQVGGSPGTGVGASVVGRTSEPPGKVENNQERRPFLEADTQDRCLQMAAAEKVLVPEPPPELTSSTVREALSGACATRIDTGYHTVYFDQNVPRGRLGFRVSWEAQQPFACVVVPGGEADRQGIIAGDILAEINGLATNGRTKDELFPRLSVRPLTLKLYRNSACDSCGYACLPNETFCSKCGKKRRICTCGEIFVPDAVFCRRCGAPDPDSKGQKLPSREMV
jgi:hypothetical protein